MTKSNIILQILEDPEVPSSDDERKEVVNIETWLNKQDIRYAFQCKEVKDNGYMVPRYVVTICTKYELFILHWTLFVNSKINVESKCA